MASDLEISKEQKVETKASLFNVNERVFNLVIKDHIDDIEGF